MTDAADPLSPALDNVTATMVAQLQSDDPKRFAVVKRLLTIAQMLKREMGTPSAENFRQQPAQGMFVNGIDQLFDEDDNHVRPIGAGGFALQDVADLQRNTLMVAQEALEVQKRKLERKKSKPGDDYPSRLRKLAKALKTCVSAYDAMYGSSFRAGRVAYARLWDAINRKPRCSWSENPWVWAVSFRLAAPGPGRGV